MSKLLLYPTVDLSVCHVALHADSAAAPRSGLEVAVASCCYPSQLLQNSHGVCRTAVLGNQHRLLVGLSARCRWDEVGCTLLGYRPGTQHALTLVGAGQLTQCCGVFCIWAVTEWGCHREYQFFAAVCIVVG